MKSKSAHASGKSPAALFLLMAGVLINNSARAQAVITVDPSKTYQTMTGWETVPICWEEDKINNRFDISVLKNLDAVLSTLVNKLGVNRIKFAIPSGIETTTDYWPSFVSGQITYTEWASHRYEKVNDNDDPGTVNPDGFQWARMDWYVENIVLPMQRLMAANGEKLFINVNYVDFNTSVQTFSHAKSPAEYAELITVVFQHLRDKYSITPDGLEIMLEPDLVTDWTPAAVGQCMVAAVNRLNANGFFPSQIIAPSVTNPANCVRYYDQMVAAVPASAQTINVLGYHRYWGPSVATLQGIDGRAKAAGLPTAMTEWLDATIHTLMQDLKLVNVTFWEQWGLCAKKNSGHDYLWADFTNPGSPVIRLSSWSNLLQQYFKYVRMDAVRIEAASTDTAKYGSVAFRNANGTYAVVVNNRSTAPFTVRGLPAGTYGITYSSGISASTVKASNVSLPDVTIGAGEFLIASGGDSGAVTIFSRLPGTSTGSLPAPEASAGLDIFPNPFSDRVTFVMSRARDNEECLLEIYDLSGRKIRAMAVAGPRPLALGKGSLRSGAYVYKFYTGKKLSGTGKIVLQR